VSGPQWPHLILSGKSKETARGTCNKWAWPAILGRVELLLHIIYDNLDSVADRRPPYPDLRSQVFGFRLSAFGSRWASPFHSSPVRQVIWLTERSHWRCACEHHHHNIGRCVWPPRLDSTSGSQPPAFTSVTCCQIASTGLRAQINAKWHV